MIHEPLIPCRKCNDIHKGATLHHIHEDTEGVGYVRLLVNGGAEFCWRCSCRKSSWTNVLVFAIPQSEHPSH
jgi:hypothetical protein